MFFPLPFLYTFNTMVLVRTLTSFWSASLRCTDVLVYVVDTCVIGSIGPFFHRLKTSCPLVNAANILYARSFSLIRVLTNHCSCPLLLWPTNPPTHDLLTELAVRLSLSSSSSVQSSFLYVPFQPMLNLLVRHVVTIFVLSDHSQQLCADK